MLNIGRRSVEVSWIPPLIQDQNGPLIYYEIKLLQSQFDSVSNITLQSNQISINVAGLEEYTTYSVVVAAATATGLGPFSSPITFITREDGR